MSLISLPVRAYFAKSESLADDIPRICTKGHAHATNLMTATNRRIAQVRFRPLAN